MMRAISTLESAINGDCNSNPESTSHIDVGGWRELPANRRRKAIIIQKMDVGNFGTLAFSHNFRKVRICDIILYY